MTNRSMTADFEQALKVTARRARALHAVSQALGWSTLPVLLTIAGSMLSSALHLTGNEHLFAWLTLAATPLFLLFLCMMIEMMRASAACRKLRSLFLVVHRPGSRLVSPAAIGPLLDMMQAVEADVNFFEVPVALLGELLESAREEDHVVLSEAQRGVLHRLVIRGRWDREWLKKRSEPVFEKAFDYEARPPAIHALAWLGDRSSIAVLERFAAQTGDVDLRAAALLSTEQIRRRLVYSPEELLRGSSAPNGTAMLLRAARAERPAEAGELLRANGARASVQVGDDLNAVLGHAVEEESVVERGGMGRDV